MNRKQRRALDKQTGKDSSQELSSKVAQFQNLPDMCLMCEKPFDKKSKQMAKTWSVVVRDENTVRLYCPECWNTANNIINDFKQEIEKNAGK
tara:strand:- start:1141 stop:1416 length:276 start_codon:yes stop_codon:yes gene_type:complete